MSLLHCCLVFLFLSSSAMATTTTTTTTTPSSRTASSAAAFVAAFQGTTRPSARTKATKYNISSSLENDLVRTGPSRPRPFLAAARAAAAAEMGVKIDDDVEVRNDETPPVDLPGRRGVAYPQQTPHSGRHFLPSHPSYHRNRNRRRIRSALRRLNPFRRPALRTKRSRFMEGWYYRVTLPEEGESFAFIFSVDDPRSHLDNGGKKKSELSLAAMQVMGPDDEYLVQCDRDETKLWAWEGSQGLGCTFEWNEDEGDDDESTTTTAMSPPEWRRRVRSGFQVLPTSLQGRLDGHDGSGTTDLDVLSGKDGGVAGACSFDMTFRPLSGWGDSSLDSSASASDRGTKQLSTAGWLASFSVFEPHWQVTMADGRATGTISWKGKTYDFVDAPFYAEKNWGGSFPRKWYWVQCNAFEGYTGKSGEKPALSVTAGGGIRGIPPGSRTESLGMVCVHYDGVFYEAVPWTGTTKWDVDPWGRWVITGRCASGERMFEAEIVATCPPEDVPGVVLRAPTGEDGLVYQCRDSFYANATLSLWELVPDEERKGEFVRADGPPIIDGARSGQGGVEVGGGPWWDNWSGTSEMKQPMRGMVQFPYLFQRARRRLFRRRG